MRHLAIRDSYCKKLTQAFQEGNLVNYADFPAYFDGCRMAVWLYGHPIYYYGFFRESRQGWTLVDTLKNPEQSLLLDPQCIRTIRYDMLIDVVHVVTTQEFKLRYEYSKKGHV